MELTLADRLKKAWNAFANRDPTLEFQSSGHSYFYRPDRPRLSRGNDRSVVTSVYNRIAVDAASLTIQHCRLDEDDRFKEVVNSSLNECLNLSANLDQTGRAFLQDVCMSMFDEGVVCIVPVETDRNPHLTDSYDIYSLRTGKIVQWYPSKVRVQVYNEWTAKREEILMPKNDVCIVENPFFAVMNESNSTAQRLIKKLSLLDVTDEQTASGKLDLIIQLPYVVKSDARREQANRRRKEIEDQLAHSKYGIAYADGTEKITQLNRSVENNLMKQVEYLTQLLFSQLGITQSIMDGTADEKTMQNYYVRTIEPVMAAIVDEMKRKFLTKTARSQKQTIMYFNDPFRLIPVTELAEIADKMTRNEILSSNEVRQKMGFKPSSDPKADQLVNANISQPEEKVAENTKAKAAVDNIIGKGGKSQNE